jgi:hypothetical protein
MKDILIISCIFGKKFNKTYKAPLDKNCVFFTNNKALKDEIINNGWKYFYIDFELTDDSIISSLQSKYIKFLIFLKDFSEYNKFSQIIYTDHKFNLLETHIDKLLIIHNNDPKKCIIIRKTPRKKTTIYDEINEAKIQKRYLKNMNDTILFIENKLNTNQYSHNIRISNTGIIMYSNVDSIIPLLDDVYNSCIKLQQPECQIFWALFSQKYSEYINQIDFNNVNPLWKCP